MAETAGMLTGSSESKYCLTATRLEIDWFIAAAHVKDVMVLREQYRCPHFRILVIGRANAGKTTILEKVCGVEKGTIPIIIYDKKGKWHESRAMQLLMFGFF